MKNKRSTLMGGKWYPQYRYFWLYIIPTPLWRIYSYGDNTDLIPYIFDTKEECDHFLEPV